VSEKRVSSDIAQLKMLLAYWLEHNTEHAGEFEEWAEKISSSEKEVSELLESAVVKMKEINVCLEKAIKLLS